jgi:hypothetical protein
MESGMTERKRDDESGQYVGEYPPERILDALRALGGDGTTTEVEEEVGCAYRTAHAKLSELEEDGRITSRKVGNARLWSVVEDGDQEGDQ